MTKRLSIVLLCLTYACVPPEPVPVSESMRETSSVLPIDPAVRIGHLENGLTYYIRTNSEPENRAELRLVVNAGSVLEDDDQQGLAHLLEHMAFNGTNHFEKQQLVDYLESIGTKFGPDLNAYTSFDQTVYMLKVPTDSLDQLATAFQILEDWAHNITLDPEEIDKERGVVHEEWRLGRGAQARMRDKQFPILFKDSQYAKRLPIGQYDVIDTAHYETIRRFYRDWYRPDLMAIMAVGDFDPGWVEEKIISHFNGLTNPQPERERIYFPVPNHDEELVATATDPEATMTFASLYIKRDPVRPVTVTDYRDILIHDLLSEMLNARLEERTRESDPPFIFGFTGQGSFVRTKNIVYLGAAMSSDKIVTGLRALLEEVERARRFGFTQTELEREKAEQMKWIEKTYNDRENISSRRLVNQYINHFLLEEPVPGIENDYALYKMLLPDISLDEVNAAVPETYTRGNNVFMINAPEKEGVSIPDDQEILVLSDDVATMDITPYVDNVSDEPLIANTLANGTIIQDTVYDNVGIKEWTLSNGVKVQFKVTDFKNDEILFSAQSPGGHSLTSDSNFLSAAYATAIITSSGLAQFDVNTFKKKMSGKVVSVRPWISNLQEGLSGNTRPEDLETLMQIIYLYFTQPRADSVGFNAFLQLQRGVLENRSASPEAAYRDTLNVTLANYHSRRRPMTIKRLQEINLDSAFSFYVDRFRDASDFTFFFVGAIDTAVFRPLVEYYLGSLPAFSRRETWRDIGVRTPENTVKKAIYRGVEPKSLTTISFSAPFDWTPYNEFILKSSVQAMRIKLREVLREDQSGTYGVRLSAGATHYPIEQAQLTISFGADPDRIDTLTTIVFDQIDSLKQFGLSDKYVKKVREILRRERETNLRKNRFWLGTMRSFTFHGRDYSDFDDYDEWIAGFSSDHIRETVNALFTDRYVRVTLYPENGESP